MSSGEEIPGIRKAELHRLEAQVLMDAALAAYENGDYDKYKKLWDQAGDAKDQEIADVVDELIDGDR